MKLESIWLTIPNEAEPVELTAYLPDNSEQIDPQRKRKTVIVCAGGGYRYRSDREAEPYALQLLAAGCNAFVLHYHLPPQIHFPQPQLELAAAVRHVRENAELYHVQPDKIIVAGGSAGGHLACSLGVFWSSPMLYEPLNCEPEAIRPDGMILSYPVITGGEYAHKDSMRRLFGTEDPAVWEPYSLENHVHAGVPATFVWHTYEDELVPVENTLMLAAALRKHHVPLEMHIFPHGPHGLSLNTPEVYGPGVSFPMQNVETRCWLDLAKRWIEQL